jgi:hypothetical protein
MSISSSIAHVDQFVDRPGFDQSLFQQKGFKGLDPQCRF